MVVNTRRARRAAVQTRAGMLLGRLSSIDFDAETGRLRAIHVSPRGAVAGLLSDELLIGWQHIVSMTEKMVIVEDGFAPTTELRLAHVKET